jgi:hypothetical protein
VSYTCPICSRTSYHPDDEKYSYCGNCHGFTGAYGYGNERHRSSSTPAGQERKMRMPTNDEDGKAQPEVSQMQGEGDCPSLLALRRERMGREDEPPLHTVSGIGVSGSVEPKWTTPETRDGTIQWLAPEKIATVDPPQWMEYPSKYRFYFGACALGVGLGISWTLSLTSSGVLRHVSKGYVITFLYGVVAVTFAAQAWMLYRWDRALKKRRAEMAEFWDKNLDPEVNPFKEKI